ncbi:MAG: hypothetical protein WC729_03895 [Sphingomonas sp.]|uniref:hypothetical protein n=1 Tax=Sphingomonas sp. TaxID=28214 RepID=UPI003569AFC5
MRHISIATLIATIAIVAPVAATAAPPAVPELSRAEQLEVMADYFLPRAIADVSREICNTGYRTRLTGDPEMAAPEKDMPGLIDRMVATASAQCDRELPLLLDRHREAVRAYWAKEVTPQQLARVAAALAPSALAAREVKVEVRPGDTLEQIQDRTRRATAEKRAQLERSTPAPVVAPGDETLAARVKTYGATSQKDLDSDPHGTNVIIDEAMRASIHAANLYVHEKGFSDIFGEPPAPSGTVAK